jgi:hypothetical protein
MCAALTHEKLIKHKCRLQFPPRCGRQQFRCSARRFVETVCFGATRRSALGRTATVDDQTARVQTRRSLNGHEQSSARGSQFPLKRTSMVLSRSREWPVMRRLGGFVVAYRYSARSNALSRGSKTSSTVRSSGSRRRLRRARRVIRARACRSCMEARRPTSTHSIAPSTNWSRKDSF